MPTDVFISYSRKDSEFALKLRADLERRGINVWLDQSDIVAGDAWRKQIVEGIEGCRVFLIILSPQSAASENVTKELSVAEGAHKKIIPILYQPVDIPEGMEYQLAGLQYQAFNQGTYEDNFARLVGAITSQPIRQIVPQVAEAVPSVPAKRPVSEDSRKYIGVVLGVGCVIVLLAVVGAIGAFVLGATPTPTISVFPIPPISEFRGGETVPSLSHTAPTGMIGLVS